MDLAAQIVVSVFAFICVALTVIGLPGTWLMLLAVVAVEFGRPDVFSWTTIIALGVLAVIGEVLETLSGAIGAGKAGASKRAGIGAIVGGIIGAIVGSIVLAFLPIIGTLIGSVIGAAVGAIALELTKNTGETQGQSDVPEMLRARLLRLYAGLRARAGHLRRVGLGAAIGRALSIVLKGSIALVMAAWLTVAAFTA